MLTSATVLPARALLTTDDHRLRAGFESLTLADGAFAHRAHVRLTWGYLQEGPASVVADRLCASLRAFATSRGAPERFHHTLTLVWVALIAHASASHPHLGFDALSDACGWLLDKEAPLRYYSRDRLFSREARERWVAPDLEALP